MVTCDTCKGSLESSLWQFSLEKIKIGREIEAGNLTLRMSILTEPPILANVVCLIKLVPNLINVTSSYLFMIRGIFNEFKC